MNKVVVGAATEPMRGIEIVLGKKSLILFPKLAEKKAKKLEPLKQINLAPKKQVPQRNDVDIVTGGACIDYVRECGGIEI